ncbi:MAG: histidinol-phosphate transaminase [Oscillospiraceae bacterium]|nr:histidinol-phosphate transaminase [Oscillospiraceae bacterium]
MSRYMSPKYSDLKPYVPGEQPRERSYIKLNTNESPFPPSPRAQEYAQKAAQSLQLYSDPDCTEITKKIAELYGMKPTQVLFGNGSDEVLFLAFMCFCDANTPAVFPDITYGFYKVFAQFLSVPYTQIPLQDDFTVNPQEYRNTGKTVFIANPNAPTGHYLGLDAIEEIVKSNPDNVVVIDEAYIDFGGQSAVSLIDRYDNLLVTQTFSKSRSLAGGRLGMIFGNEALIADLRMAKYSINPYNVNSMTMAAGLGALLDEEYTRENCKKIVENRQCTTMELKKLGFTVLNSNTNFILAGHHRISGADLYKALKEKGILVRYFDTPRLKPFVRITIGTRQEMESLTSAVCKILEEYI